MFRNDRIANNLGKPAECETRWKRHALAAEMSRGTDFVNTGKGAWSANQRLEVYENSGDRRQQVGTIARVKGMVRPRRPNHPQFPFQSG